MRRMAPPSSRGKRYCIGSLLLYTSPKAKTVHNFAFLRIISAAQAKGGNATFRIVYGMNFDADALVI